MSGRTVRIRAHCRDISLQSSLSPFCCFQTSVSSNTSRAISAALLPEALLSAWIFTAKKYVLSEVSVKPTKPAVDVLSVHLPGSGSCRRGFRRERRTAAGCPLQPGYFPGQNQNVLRYRSVRSFTCSMGEIFSPGFHPVGVRAAGYIFGSRTPISRIRERITSVPICLSSS